AAPQRLQRDGPTHAVAGPGHDQDLALDLHATTVLRSTGSSGGSPRFAGGDMGAGRDRRPVTYQTSTSPLPLTGISPRRSSMNPGSSRSAVARVTWIWPGVPCDSIRLAVFTAS